MHLDLNNSIRNFFLNSVELFLDDKNGAGQIAKHWLETEATEEQKKEFYEYWYKYVGQVCKFCDAFLKENEPPFEIPYKLPPEREKKKD